MKRHGPKCGGADCKFRMNRRDIHAGFCDPDAIHEAGMHSIIYQIEAQLGIDRPPTAEEWKQIAKMPCPCYQAGTQKKRTPKRPQFQPVQRSPRQCRYDWREAQSLQDQGCTPKEIARHMGCAESSVFAWLKRTGQTANYAQQTLRREGEMFTTGKYNYDRVPEMWAAGMSRHAIAVETGIPYKTLSNWLNRNGYAARDSRKQAATEPQGGRPGVFDKAEAFRLYQRGWSDGRIGRELGINDKTIYAWRRRAGLPANPQEPKRLTPEQEKQRGKLYRQGKTDKEIGDACGVHPSCIHRWRKKHGLPPNAKSGGNTWEYRKEKQKKL